MKCITKLYPRIHKLKFKNNYPHCGRDICYCMYQLNLSNPDERKYYKECYKIWFNNKKKRLNIFD